MEISVDQSYIFFLNLFRFKISKNIIEVEYEGT